MWTLIGLPLRLADDPPRDAEPTNVIEIPRRPGYGRLYDPPEISAVKTVPIADVLSGVRGSDWVVAKIDFAVECGEVYEWDLDSAWSQFVLDPAGSLPGWIGLPVGASQPYGEFVGLLQGVLTGGAESIVVEVRETLNAE